MTDDFDRTLHDAFQARHVPHDIQPSLVDVRWRARRRHSRRKAAVVGCAAVTGAGAVSVLAVRHPGDDGRGAGSGAGATAAGAGDLPATTIACYQFPTSTIAFPPTTTTPVNTLPPTTVLEFEATTTTTLPPFADPRGFQVPCESGTEGPGAWHCTDPLGVDEFGREMFVSCEQQFGGVVATTVPAAVLPTVSTIEFPMDTSTTITVPLADLASTTTSLG